MNKKFRLMMFFVAFLVIAPLALGQQTGSMAFTVTMEPTEARTFHVALCCVGLKGSVQDFKLPMWSPGYYRLSDYARNVSNFKVVDGTDKALPWEKTNKNTWRVASDESDLISVTYDVNASGRGFVTESSMSDNRALISPTGVFMYVAGQRQQPVTVFVKLPPQWSRVLTGLDPIKGQAHTFRADNFDILYDGPILIGNHEVLEFAVKGIPHYIALESVPGTLDRDIFIADLKKMVESAVAICGEIPYKQYVFMIMGAGGGGLEHLSSTVLFTNVANATNPRGNKSWLSFVAHEYFHLYNVKSIRPIALGPFDYERENYTNMLWVSEGFTVYYEYIILNRAGLLARDECLERFSSTIAKCENSPGRLLQSVADASYNAWTQSFFGSEKEVSYYDKGAILATLLDLKIRHETKNQNSLDNVMQILYQQYYKEKNRGFTDQEFRAVCEKAAGQPLDEVFEYAYTTKGIDYPKYFSYAGLEIEMPREQTEKGTFKISPLPNPNPLQATILKDWLKE